MEHLTEPTWWAFLIQEVLLLFYIPGTYLAYRWVRIPLRRKRVKQALSQLGIAHPDEWQEAIGSEYRTRDYAWPLFLACAFTSVTYAMTHPYVIQLGLWAGFLPEVYDFGADELFPRAIAAGSMLFWGWLGAWSYSMQFTFRRFLALDLSPSVYLFTTSRFLLAFVIGGVVAIGALSLRAADVPFNEAWAIWSAVTFFIGYFPEQGLNWITVTAQKALKQRGGISKEVHLSRIEGLSIWHQGRLKQEGIDNAQTLATANIPDLVISTPFAVGQIVDWVDQAILLVHTGGVQFEALGNVGVIRASAVLTNTDDRGNLDELAEATGLKKSELRVLSRGLRLASNTKLVTRFRRQPDLDTTTTGESASTQPIPARSAPADMVLPREQEAIMFEEEKGEPQTTA